MSGISKGAADEVYDLLGRGEADRALTLIQPGAQSPGATHAELAAYAEALKAVGRRQDALEVYQRCLRIAPNSAVAEHNLAALQGDMGLHADAEAGARRAFAKGLSGPETWAVLARAAEGQGRYADADTAYREALRLKPTLSTVQRDYAQLLWSQTGDLPRSTALLRNAVTAFPQVPALALQLARACQYGGDPRGAYDVVIGALGRSSGMIAELETAASVLAQELGRPAAAEQHADRALALAPQKTEARIALCDAYLALGRPARAAAVAKDLLAAAPDAPQLLARLATAWRLLGDERYYQLCDYDSMVRTWTIDTPPGWPSLPAYLTDLAAALAAGHQAITHPYDQSVRHGTQTHTDLSRWTQPAVQAFFAAVDGPIRRHLAAIGQGPDPLRRRNTGNYRIEDAWSVRLRSRGFHVNHIHQKGWLSSACHIALPASIQGDGREGWLKLGEPGVATAPPLAAERWLKPAEGVLILFPSYMWHGTTPVAGDEHRLTIAFDVVPA